MRPLTTTCCVRWTRGLVSLVLVLGLGLQGVPLHSLVQHLHASSAHHTCNHPAGVCPMNPDGPCTCSHAGPDTPDTPTFVPCNGAAPDGVTTAVVKTWILDAAAGPPAPAVRPLSRPPVFVPLSSQRWGDRPFRPPWTVATDRPVPSRPAPTA